MDGDVQQVHDGAHNKAEGSLFLLNDEDATFLKCFAFDDSASDLSGSLSHIFFSFSLLPLNVHQDAGNDVTKSLDSTGEQNDSVLPSPPPPPHYQRLLAATKSPAQKSSIDESASYLELFRQQHT